MNIFKTFLIGGFLAFLLISHSSAANWVTKNVTNNSSVSKSPSIVVKGLNQYLVWSDNRDGAFEIYLMRSHNGGSTWTTTKLTNTTGNATNPSISVNGSILRVVWSDNVSGNQEIYLLESTDWGNTWSVPVRLTNNSAVSSEPSISVDRENIYVAWSDNRTGNYEIYIKSKIEATKYILNCPKSGGPTGLTGTDPFNPDHANFELDFTSQLIGKSIKAIAVEIAYQGTSLTNVELKDASTGDLLAVSNDKSTTEAGWIEFAFYPSHIIDGRRLLVNFAVATDARIFNCAETVGFIPTGMTAYGKGLLNHMARVYILIE